MNQVKHGYMNEKFSHVHFASPGLVWGLEEKDED